MGSDISKASKNTPEMLCLEYLIAEMGLAVLHLISYLLKRADVEKRQDNRVVLVNSRESKQHTLP